MSRNHWVSQLCSKQSLLAPWLPTWKSQLFESQFSSLSNLIQTISSRRTTLYSSIKCPNFSNTRIKFNWGNDYQSRWTGWKVRVLQLFKHKEILLWKDSQRMLLRLPLVQLEGPCIERNLCTRLIQTWSRFQPTLMPKSAQLHSRSRKGSNGTV